MKHLAIIATIIASGSLGCAGSVPCAQVTPVSAVAAERPLAVRAEAGVLWASAGVWAEPHRVWMMPAHGAVEGLAVDAMPGDTGYVVTFRQGGVQWQGRLDASRAGRGQLRQMPELMADAQR